MYLYRIAKKLYSKDLSGKGAALFGGRWNNPGFYVLYTSSNPALAMLECLVHITQMQFASDFELVTLELPNDVTIHTVPVEKLPPNWQMSPAPQSLALIGDSFVQKGISLGLSVPSVLVPEMNNIILNVTHPDMKLVKLVNSRPLNFDERLWK